MYEIPSPYYFVPQQNFVFEPNWAGQVSHDIPFSDGLSGELEIKVEAMRPIYVRSQAQKPEAENPDERSNSNYLKRFHVSRDIDPSTDEREQFNEWISFSKLNGKPAIPGTTIKGVIRNVIKVAAFGSFRETLPPRYEDEDRFSIRDLNWDPYKQLFVQGGKIDRATNEHSDVYFLAEAGWLVLDGEDWKLYPCSSYQRVERDELLKSFASHFQNGDTLCPISAEKSPNPEVGAVKAKYELWEKRVGSLDISYTPGIVKNQNLDGRHLRSGKDGRKLPLHYGLATGVGTGTAKGRLVFTGQPSARKHMEFIFELPAHCIVPGNDINLDDMQIKAFASVHAEAKAWEYWRPKFEKGEPVPVFWLRESSTSLRLKAFGLAQMFRFPADRTLRDGVFPVHRPDVNKKQDLADLIFGTLHEDALRGRAAFSHFQITENNGEHPAVWTILGSPKPSFYPNYLEQEYDSSTGHLKNG